jgi:AcrR family transcriptional regulator
MARQSKLVKTYHHGNLHAALLEAAEAELVERGVEKFSLRGVAKRAGVSHAAPAHHFKDADGLLTALAKLSFERFLESMEKRVGAAGPDPADRLVASGLGYIDYATANPALFDLQFFSDRPNKTDDALCSAGAAAYGHLRDHVAAVLETRSPTPLEIDAASHFVWATSHGMAALFAGATTGMFKGMTPAARDAEFGKMLRRVVDAL